MEFVVVTCGGQARSVFIDQQNQGITGRRLSVPEGLHVFDLGKPVDYAPPFQQVNVTHTGPQNPMSIAFSPLIAVAVTSVAPRPALESVASPRAVPRKRRAKRRAASKKRAAKRRAAPKKRAGGARARRSSPRRTVRRKGKRTAGRGKK